MNSPVQTSKGIFQQKPILRQGNMRKNDSWQTIANQSEGHRDLLLCGALRLIFNGKRKKMGTVFRQRKETILSDTLPCHTLHGTCTSLDADVESLWIMGKPSIPGWWYVGGFQHVLSVRILGIIIQRLTFIFFTGVGIPRTSTNHASTGAGA